jgi:hypothetical protein
MFRFTIRDVLWLVLAVALALSWQLDRRLANKRLATTEEERDKSIAIEKMWKARAKEIQQQLYDAINPPITQNASPDKK